MLLFEVVDDLPPSSKAPRAGRLRRRWVAETQSDGTGSFVFVALRTAPTNSWPFIQPLGVLPWKSVSTVALLQFTSRRPLESGGAF